MELDEKMLLLLVYLAGGILLVILALPLIRNKVKPNYWYGFRVAKTLEDPDIWYAVNRYTGKWLLVTGVCTIIGALILYLIPGLSLDAYALAVLGVFVAAFSICLVQSIRYLRSL